MIKADYYPYKKGAMEKAFKDIDSTYNLSIADVDFDAEPKVVNFMNFVDGKCTRFHKVPELRETTEFEDDMIISVFKTEWRIKSHDLPELKAVLINEHGRAYEVPAYQINIKADE